MPGKQATHPWRRTDKLNKLEVSNTSAHSLRHVKLLPRVHMVEMSPLFTSPSHLLNSEVKAVSKTASCILVISNVFIL